VRACWRVRQMTPTSEGRTPPSFPLPLPLPLPRQSSATTAATTAASVGLCADSPPAPGVTTSPLTPTKSVATVQRSREGEGAPSAASLSSASPLARPCCCRFCRCVPLLLVVLLHPETARVASHRGGSSAEDGPPIPAVEAEAEAEEATSRAPP